MDDSKGPLGSLKRTSSITSLPDNYNPATPLHDCSSNPKQDLNQLSTNKDTPIITSTLRQLLQEPGIRLTASYRQKINRELDVIDERYNQAHTFSGLADSHQNLQDTLDQVLSSQVAIQQQITELNTRTSSFTYADAMKRTKSPQTSTDSSFVVKTKEGAQLKNLTSKLTELSCPKGIPITKMRHTKIFTEVRTNNPENKEVLKTFIKNNLPEAIIEDKMQKTSRFIFHNASAFEEEEIMDAIKIKGFEEKEIKHIHSIPSKKGEFSHYIMELPRQKSNNTLLLNYSPDRPAFLMIGFKRLYFRPYIRLIRCRNCQKLDSHLTHACKNSKFCSKCSSNHPEENCNNKLFCINCDERNAKLKNPNDEHFDVHHAASDPVCPTYRALFHALLSNSTTQRTNKPQNHLRAVAPKLLNQ